MKPAETQLSKQNLWDYAMKLPARKNPLGKGNLRSAQFEPTYFEFSGACAGCGETPYINMVTRLFGDRMMIANATGCSSIYGASSSMPYTKNAKGQGPAWANSSLKITQNTAWACIWAKPNFGTASPAN